MTLSFTKLLSSLVDCLFFFFFVFCHIIYPQVLQPAPSVRPSSWQRLFVCFLVFFFVRFCIDCLLFCCFCLSSHSVVIASAWLWLWLQVLLLFSFQAPLLAIEFIHVPPVGSLQFNSIQERGRRELLRQKNVDFLCRCLCCWCCCNCSDMCDIEIKDGRECERRCHPNNKYAAVINNGSQNQWANLSSPSSLHLSLSSYAFSDQTIHSALFSYVSSSSEGVLWSTESESGAQSPEQWQQQILGFRPIWSTANPNTTKSS